MAVRQETAPDSVLADSLGTPDAALRPAHPAGGTGSGRQKGGIAVDRDQLVDAMTEAGWSQAKAGRLHGLTSRQIGYAIKRLGIPVRQI